MTTPVLEHNTLQGLCDLLSPGQIAEIYSTFLQHTQEKIELLRTDCPPEQARREAHSLKGSAGMLGASVLAEIAEEMEHNTFAGEALAERVHALQTALDAFALAIQAAGVEVAGVPGIRFEGRETQA